MSRKLKQIIMAAGLVLAVPGVFMLLAVVCVVPLAVLSDDQSALSGGLFSFTALAVTLGAGGVTAWHGRRSLRGQPSAPLRLPPAWLMAGIFGLCVAAGSVAYQNNIASGLIFPPLLLVAAALPPLLAIAWFMNQEAGGLSWRRGLVAMAGGATVSVALAIFLEILLPVIVLALVFNLGSTVTRHMDKLLSALAGKDIAEALSNPGFIYLFIEVAVIAPLAEELAKPLVTLPLIGRLSRRDAFLVAAMAGAGFASLENVLYAGMGVYLWAGILLVRALGCAIHPLGAGLVGLSWRDILRGEPRAWQRGLLRFGLAAGMHAVWNGGSLLVITLGGAQFFGRLPPEINILGLSAAGTTLALLVVLGLAALWLGRATAGQARLPDGAEGVPAEAQFILSDRAVAIWALACLVAIVPAGITGLRLLMR